MVNNNLVGGWPTPLKNDGVRQLGWWHSQLLGLFIKFMFQTANQSPHVTTSIWLLFFKIWPRVLPAAAAPFAIWRLWSPLWKPRPRAVKMIVVLQMPATFWSATATQHVNMETLHPCSQGFLNRSGFGAVHHRAKFWIWTLDLPNPCDSWWPFWFLLLFIQLWKKVNSFNVRTKDMARSDDWLYEDHPTL